MKTLAYVLAILVMLTDVFAKIAAFLFWSLALGIFGWMFGAAIRDSYKWVRVKFVPLEGQRRVA